MKPNHLSQFALMLFFAMGGFYSEVTAQVDSTNTQVQIDSVVINAFDVVQEESVTVENITSVQNTIKKPAKYTGPMPCASVNSHNGSLVPVGTYVLIGRYFNVNKDELLGGSDVIDFISPGVSGFAYQELQSAFRTGIIKGVDVR
ncbi:MAG: hypothetical protein HN708_05280 [Candidatus Marinimicrobia bacterium]|nr:hypothetical protein [Candidatus Neomarinimicrobiota bacterium]